MMKKVLMVVMPNAFQIRPLRNPSCHSTKKAEEISDSIDHFDDDTERVQRFLLLRKEDWIKSRITMLNEFKTHLWFGHPFR
jgi:hypothetical protein